VAHTNEYEKLIFLFIFSEMQETRLDLSLEETDLEDTGMDNPAFVPGDVERPSQKKNGHVGGEKKQLEAVNLELIHMSPFTNTASVPGIPFKKEVEAEGGPPDYFIPVNEHRKYMRWVRAFASLKASQVGLREVDLVVSSMEDKGLTESTFVVLQENKHAAGVVAPRGIIWITVLPCRYLFFLQAEAGVHVTAKM